MNYRLRACGLIYHLSSSLFARLIVILWVSGFVCMNERGLITSCEEQFWRPNVGLGQWPLLSLHAHKEYRLKIFGVIYHFYFRSLWNEMRYLLRSPYNSCKSSGCSRTSVQIFELSSQEWTQFSRVHQSLWVVVLLLLFCVGFCVRLKAIG